MNKWLVVWNVIVTLLVVALAFNGCSSIDPEFTALKNQVQQNRTLIQQMLVTVNDNSNKVAAQTSITTQLQLYVQTSIAQMSEQIQSLQALVIQ